MGGKHQTVTIELTKKKYKGREKESVLSKSFGEMKDKLLIPRPWESIQVPSKITVTLLKRQILSSGQETFISQTETGNKCS